MEANFFEISEDHLAFTVGADGTQILLPRVGSTRVPSILGSDLAVHSSETTVQLEASLGTLCDKVRCSFDIDHGRAVLNRADISVDGPVWSLEHFIGACLVAMNGKL